MSEKFSTDDQVIVIGKDLRGKVSFVGETEFSPGKWIGIVLTEPKGKNNGAVQGKAYFECPENYGLFVRETQLQLAESPLGAPGRLSRGGSSTPSKLSAAKSKLPGLTKASSRIPSAPSGFSMTGSAMKRPSKGARSPRLSTGPGIRKSRVGGQGTLTESSSAESLGAVSIRSESSEAAVSITKIDEDDEQGISFIAHSTNLQALSEENRKLKSDVEDLTSQLDVLKERRQADKEKLKELEKSKILVEQLQEFKQKMLEQHSQLKVELQKAQAQAKEAVEAKQSMEDNAEFLDMQENLEMALLDKEMAEEKVEELTAELQQARDDLDEVRTELEILKAEKEEQGLDESERTGEGVASKALEEQNQRLRETLVRMRDLAAQDRHNMTKIERSLEEEKTRNGELSAAKTKLDEKVADLERQILDFHEQLDAAMGAEEMVENLSNKVLTLEEKIQEMEDERQELERDYQVTQELVEAQNEAEKEFRDEIATLQSKINQMERTREELKLIVGDKESTIVKFRDFVSQLNEKIEHLSRENVEKDKIIQEKSTALQAARTHGTTSEMAEYRSKFEESRGRARALEIELRKLEAEQALRHVHYLSKFVPSNFMQRGGDHDAILLLLLLPRLARKCEIVNAALKETYSVNSEVFQEALSSTQTLLKDHSVERACFGHRISRLVVGVAGVLRQCQMAMDRCSVDAFVRMAGFFHDFAAQEKILDFYVDLLRKDQLDENVPLDGAEKAFTQIYQLLYGSISDVINLGRERPAKRKDDGYSWMTDDLWLQDSCRSFLACAEAILMEINRIKCLMTAGSESTEMGLLMKELHGDVEETRNALRRILRFLPGEGSTRQALCLDRQARDIIKSCHGRLDLVVSALHDIAKASIRQILSSGGADPQTLGVSSDKLKELAFVAVETASQKSLLRHLNSDDADMSLLGGPLVTLKKYMSATSICMADVAANLAQGKYDVSENLNDSGEWQDSLTSPLELRAVMLKDEMKDAENLRMKLELRDQDIKDLKKHLKQKQEEISELVIRRDMVEKKLSLLSQEKALSEERWARRLEDAQALLARKEKESGEILDQLQKDVDALENEKQQLKARLLAVNKFQALEGIGKIGSPGSPTSSVPPMSLPAMASTALTTNIAPFSPIVASSPITRGPGAFGNVDQVKVLEEERNGLRRELRIISEENDLLKADKMRDKMMELKPLVVSKKRIPQDPAATDDMRALRDKSFKLLDDIHKKSVSTLVDLSKRQGRELPQTDLTWPAAELLRGQKTARELKDALNTLRQNALNLEIEDEVGGKKLEQFGRTFARPELTKALQEKESSKGDGVLVAKVTIPAKLANLVKLPDERGKPVQVQLNHQEWSSLLMRLGP